MAIGKKSKDQLILEDKLAYSRAIRNFKANKWKRWTANEEEYEIKSEHWKQLKAGTVKELGA